MEMFVPREPGNSQVNWGELAVNFGIPDGADSRKKVLDTLVNTRSYSKVAQLWGTALIDRELRADFIDRLSSDSFDEIDVAIHGLRQAVVLPDVQSALSELALRYARGSETPLESEPGTYFIKELDPLSPVPPTEAQLSLQDFFDRARTNPINLAKHALDVLSDLVPPSEVVMDTYRRIFELRNPTAASEIRGQIFKNLSPCQLPMDRRPIYRDWLISAAIEEIAADACSANALSACHYLAFHLGKPMTAEKLAGKMPKRGDIVSEDSDVISGRIIDITVWGIEKYQVVVSPAIRQLIDKINEAPLGRWPLKNRDERLLPLFD